MTLVKICGITNVEDARTAIEAGADMLGFNFYRPSPRFIEPKDAREVISGLRPETESSNRTVITVGVFVNESTPQSLLGLANLAGVDAVQLHGNESVEFCRELKALLKERLLIKALNVGQSFVPEEASGYAVDAVMLDAYHSTLRGGTGQRIDWDIARRTRELAPRLFLAGGLSPENIAAAIATVQPYGVDACSSLEVSPRKKNAERVKAFVRAVRSG